MPDTARPLIVSDIFGRTPALEALARELRADILAPYDGSGPRFPSEKQAYTAFLDTGGLETYTHKLRGFLTAHSETTTLIAFSAGATAAWITLAGPAGSRIRQGVLFYGSRIRDHVALRPRCPVRLIFAAHEASCNPEDLLASLTGPNLHTQIVPGSRHGFMNPLSSGYDPALYARFTRELHHLVTPRPEPTREPCPSSCRTL